MFDSISKHNNKAPGRIEGGGAVAVIDIGSNSVRLVVYERHSRAPTTLYNEKVLAGLIRGIDETGELSTDAVDKAIESIKRFKFMIEQLNVSRTFVIATAAARDAKNGDKFIKSVEKICKENVEILTGRQEAYYSAMGVISGFHYPHGIAGDMGGGSLELVEVDKQEIGQGKTFALGGIRLQEASGNNPAQSLKIARELFAKTNWLKNGKEKPFYAVGGTWRSLARLHLFQKGYPLHVMHGYTIPAREALEFCYVVGTRDTESLDFIEVVSRSRRQLLPYGASVLAAIIEQVKPADVVFSALGIREGLLYHFLEKAERNKDPLFEAASELAYLRSRSPTHVHELIAWTDQVFQVLKIEESKEEKRLRSVACLLSDIGWRAHPDYRGEQSLNIITNAGFVGLDHSARAFLGLSTYYRNHGLVDDALGRNVRELASTRLKERARILGAVLRLSHFLSGSMPGIILSTKLKMTNKTLQLIIPNKFKELQGERLLKRLRQLSKIFGLQGEIVIGS